LRLGIPQTLENRGKLRQLVDKQEIYYVPTYSDIGEIVYHSIVDIKNVGVNFHGSHVGNMQMLIFLKATKCQWRTYQCESGNGHQKTRYSTLSRLPKL